MSSKCISRAINDSNPNDRCPTIVQMHFRLWHYLKDHFSLPPCPQNASLGQSTPHTPMLGAVVLSNCISGCGITSQMIFYCPDVFKLHFLRYQPLKPRGEVPYCGPNAFQAVAVPQIPFCTAPMSSKCLCCAISPSNPLVRCPTFVKMHCRLWQYLRSLFFTAPMSSKCISCAFNPPDANVRCPTFVKRHFKLWQYLNPLTHNLFSTSAMSSKCIFCAIHPSKQNVKCPSVVKMHILRYQPVQPKC